MSHYLQGLYLPGGCLGILPSTVLHTSIYNCILSLVGSSRYRNSSNSGNCRFALGGPYNVVQNTWGPSSHFWILAGVQKCSKLGFRLRLEGLNLFKASDLYFLIVWTTSCCAIPAAYPIQVLPETCLWLKLVPNIDPFPHKQLDDQSRPAQANRIGSLAHNQVKKNCTWWSLQHQIAMVLPWSQSPESMKMVQTNMIEISIKNRWWLF